MTPRLPPVPVFIISLERRPRCGALCATLAQLGIPFEIVAAADVHDHDAIELATVYDERRAIRRVGRAMGRGEIGCALSHRSVYAILLERGIPLALVLEEDAVPGLQFKPFWQASTTLPTHIDVLSLYSEEGFVERRPSVSFAGCALHEARLMLANTVGYFIRQSCAQEMMRRNTPISMVADWPLDHHAMRQFLVLPMLVGHNHVDSIVATERPVENVLRRYRAPRWLSALFHLSYLGYVMQPGRYEGPVSYYRREVARRIRELISPAQINVRLWRAPPATSPTPARTTSASRSVDRVRQIAHSIRNFAASRKRVGSAQGPAEARRDGRRRMTTFTVVTFGTAEFSWAIEAQRRRSLKFGAHRHIAYGVGSDPVVRARSENAWLSSDPRGYGLWIWKPYILLDAIAQCDAEDYIIYLDAGIAPVDDMRPWFDQLQRRAINFFAPVPPRPLRQWTKRDCFVHMKADTPEFHNAPVLSAGIQAYRNVSESRVFLAEWKSLMRDPRLLADPQNSGETAEHPDFIAHRHDQSILTLIAALRRCTIYREPSQYGIWTPTTRQAYVASGASNADLLNEDCRQILDVHRGRNRSHSLLLQLWRIRRKIAGARHGVVCI